MILDLVIDALLVMGFGVQHSVLAVLSVKAKLKELTGLDALTWRAFQTLFNALYILAAAVFWRPVDIVVWDLTGIAGISVAAIGFLAWLWYFQIHLFEYDVGLAFGSTPAISATIGRNSPKQEMWKVGFRRWSRFPVHTAFFPMFFAFPHMTLSTLVFAVTANLYNYVGSVLYDKRLEKLAGQPYRTYQGVTGLILPSLRTPRGAAGMTMPAPVHWQNPAQYIPAAVVGLASGLLYWSLLGPVSRNFQELFLSWGIAIVFSIVAGGAIGIRYKGSFARVDDDEDYRKLQAVLATNCAIISAVSLITWVATGLLTSQAMPHPVLILPLWVTILWLGHASAFFTGARLAGRSLTVEKIEAESPNY